MTTYYNEEFGLSISEVREVFARQDRSELIKIRFAPSIKPVDRFVEECEKLDAQMYLNLVVKEVSLDYNSVVISFTKIGDEYHYFEDVIEFRGEEVSRVRCKFSTLNEVYAQVIRSVQRNCDSDGLQYIFDFQIDDDRIL